MQVSRILQDKGGEVVSVEPEALVREAARVLAERRIGAVLVKSGESILGILSERDIVRGLGTTGAQVLDAPVTRLMTANVVTARPDDRLVDIMRLMTERRFRHLPVLDEEGRLLGIISIGDVVKYRLAEVEHTAEALSDYIRTG
ncbi:MAG: CBS domain-containing protein [Alphaproteobacteria bacterium]|nr:MAG: CBS domain-containing protein [Alphaproteobacteria bacterium]